MTNAADPWSTPPRLYRVWAGVLLAPAAWAVHLTVGYALAAMLCTPSGYLALVALTAIAAAVAAAGGYLAWSLRSKAAETGGDSERRGRFMAVAGMLLSVLFLLAILSQVIPLAALPCT